MSDHHSKFLVGHSIFANIVGPTKRSDGQETTSQLLEVIQLDYLSRTSTCFRLGNCLRSFSTPRGVKLGK